MTFPLKPSIVAKNFYAVHLQPTAVKELLKTNAESKIQTINWFTKGKAELALLNATEKKSVAADQFVAAMDNPHERLKESTLKQAFIPQLQHLDMDMPRGGWLAQVMDVLGMGPKLAQAVSGQKGANQMPYGPKMAVKPLDPALLQGRLQEEGFSGLPQLREQWRQLIQTKANYLKNAPSKLEGRLQYIQAIHEALRLNQTIDSSQGKQLINRYLLLRELSKQMLFLEARNQKVSLSPESANPYKAALDTLRDKLGLEITIKTPTIIGRQMKGMALKASQLNLMIKQPGDVISHTIAHTQAKDMPSVDPIGKGQAVIHGPKILDQGEINTARNQIELKLKQDIEKRSAIFGVPTQYSLITGIETQKIIQGKTLQELFSDNPELVTRNIVSKFIQIHAMMEKLGLELTDWSLNNFMIPTSKVHSSDPPLHLVDLGSLETIPEPKRTVQDREQRRQRIANIVNSGIKNQGEIRKKISTYFAQIEKSDLEELTRKADQTVSKHTGEK